MPPTSFYINLPVFYLLVWTRKLFQMTSTLKGIFLVKEFTISFENKPIKKGLKINVVLFTLKEKIPITLVFFILMVICSSWIIQFKL